MVLSLGKVGLGCVRKAAKQVGKPCLSLVSAVQWERNQTRSSLERLVLCGIGPPLSPQTAIWAGAFRLPGKVHPGEGEQSSVPLQDGTGWYHSLQLATGHSAVVITEGAPVAGNSGADVCQFTPLFLQENILTKKRLGEERVHFDLQVTGYH